MNYIGSKLSLLNFLSSSIDQTLLAENETRPKCDMIFADLFAGTGSVGGYFKSDGYSVIANDIQYYSFVLNKHIVENNNQFDDRRVEDLFKTLNSLEGVEGFIYKNYSYGGTKWQEFRRMYFSDYNAKKCDAIRCKIEKWLKSGYINDSEYYFLIGSLINSMDKCANTASVYGAYLKELKRSAQKDMVLIPLPINIGKGKYVVFNEDANDLILKIEGDILYLDPPYNSRQYCTNYHLLETIAKYDNPKINGKTGLREYSKQKSDFCIKSKAAKVFEDLIRNAKFKYIFLSYNDEGILDLDTIKNIMSKYGKYSVFTKEYKRFKADNKRINKRKYTVEYLHCLVKRS